VRSRNTDVTWSRLLQAEPSPKLAHMTDHKTAEAVLREHFALVTRDHSRWLALFAEDAVVEFPYAPALGRPSRLDGKAAIDAYFRPYSREVLQLTFSDVRLYPTTDPSIALGEAHASARIASTGRDYEQDYVVILATKNGLISRYREYWNVLPASAAFGTNGETAPRGDVS
jgi:uncharacterized protein